MKTEFLRITPEMAADMLSRNQNNRSIRTKVVESYARDMQNGAWEETAQAITFDVDGNLLDGQHRLNAIIKAGVPQNMLVVTDAPRSSMYDAGLSRSMVDRLTMGNYDFPSSITTSFICSVCGYILAVRNGRKKLSTAEVRDFMSYNREQLEVLSDIIGTKRRLGITVAPVAAAMLAALSNGVDPEVLHKFYEVLLDGISTCDEERPIVALRNRLLTEVSGRGTTQSRVEQYKRTQYAISQYVSCSGLFRSTCPRNDPFTMARLFD